MGRANGENRNTPGFLLRLGNAIVVLERRSRARKRVSLFYIPVHSGATYIQFSEPGQNAARRIRSRYAPSGFNSLGLAVKSYENRMKPSVFNERATLIFSIAESEGIRYAPMPAHTLRFAPCAVVAATSICF